MSRHPLSHDPSTQEFDYRTMLRPEVRDDLEKFEKKSKGKRIKSPASNVPKSVKSSSHAPGFTASDPVN